MTYYKAVRPDGASFHDPTFRWLRKDGKPYSRPVRHPKPDLHGTAGYYLSIATVATDCTGFSWPCRLLAVEPVGETVPDEQCAHKVRCAAVRVTGELPAWQVFGPQGQEVVALIDRASRLTLAEAERLAAARAAAWAAARAAARAAAWAAARAAARVAAWDAAWAAAWAAARAAAWDAAWDAVAGLLVRDLITPEQFDLLYGSWASVMA